MNRNLLAECRACGREVSRRAKECPDCREPRPTLTEEEYQKTTIDLYKKFMDWLDVPVEGFREEYKKFMDWLNVPVGGTTLKFFLLLSVIWICWFLLILFNR